MRMNLPNQITTTRFFLAIIFLVLLASFDCKRLYELEWMINTCFVLFVVAAGTDALDGYLARKHNQVTSFGRVLDPFVDKILVVGGFIMLLGNNFQDADGVLTTGLQAWMIVVIVGRELLVSGLRGFSEAQGKAYAANWLGKIKMILQCVTMGWILASLGWLRDVVWVQFGRPFMIWLTVFFTAASVITYLMASRDVLAEQSRE